MAQADNAVGKKKIKFQEVYSKYNKKHNLSMQIGILLIFILYLFFFLSPVIFVSPSSTEYTKLNEMQSLGDDRTVGVEIWKYSKSQQLMEVQLNIENNSYDGEDYYDYTSFVNFIAESKGKEQISVEIKLQQLNFVVIWLHDIPDDFNSCSLNIYLKNDDETYASVFTNSKKVKKVDEIIEKSEEEYQIEKIEREIKKYNKQIEKNNKKIETLKEEINTIRIHIEETKKNEAYQSKSEILESEELIESYNNQISDREYQISSLQKDNTDAKSKITEYNDLKKDLTATDS
jgi:hypothetical protein